MYIRGFFFRKYNAVRLLAVFFIFILSLVLLFILTRPDVYEASSVIEFGAQDRGIIGAHKNIIESRGNAYHIFRKLKLYRIEKFKKAKDPTGTLLRDLEFGMMDNGRMLKISSRNVNPRLAAYIANEFAKDYVGSRMNRSRVNSARVYSIAEPPLLPVGYDKRRILASGLLMAIFFGSLTMVLLRGKERDPGIKGSRFIIPEGLPILGIVPKIRTNGKSLPAKGDAFFAVKNDLSPMVTESYYSIRKNLLFSLEGPYPAPESICITSLAPGEGKTITAVNLAAVWANSGERVLLVDADIKNPRIHAIFGGKNKPGFSDFISKGSDFNKIVKPSGTANLHIVASGGSSLRFLSDRPNFSKRSKDFLRESAVRFSKVIFDASSVVTDQGYLDVLSSLTTATVLVSKSKDLKRRTFDSPGEFIGDRRTNVIGIILNNMEVLS